MVEFESFIDTLLVTVHLSLQDLVRAKQRQLLLASRRLSEACVEAVAECLQSLTREEVLTFIEANDFSVAKASALLDMSALSFNRKLAMAFALCNHF